MSAAIFREATWGMNILIQLLTRKRIFSPDVPQGYAKEALNYVKELMDSEDRPKVIGFYCDFDNVHWVKTLRGK